MDIDPDEANGDDPMFGEGTIWGLDSIDALQIALAIQNIYGITINDSKDMRRVMTSFNTFAEFIYAEKTIG